MIPTKTDFTLTGGGTIYLLRPQTEAARDWVDAYLPDDAQWLGGAVAIEHRYVDDIVDGITSDGLEVS